MLLGFKVVGEIFRLGFSFVFVLSRKLDGIVFFLVCFLLGVFFIFV